VSPDPLILHVDMDAFFAAVEVLDDPSLAGQPLIVGGDGRRGVVASCSYEARCRGVRSAMPSATARRRCPTAVFRPPRHGRYREVSERLGEVFGRFTPLVEFVSIDEAFLDLTGAARRSGSVEEIARRVRDEVAESVGLTCSVGAARTKFLAKLASEAAKPTAGPGGVRAGAGVVVVAPDGELDFLHPLPVEALWGVGPATSRRLRSIGVGTVGALAATPLEVVSSAVGSAVGRHLHQLSLGVDPRPVEPDRTVKSVGHEETFPVDVWDPAELHRHIVRLADAVAARLRHAGVKGRTVQLKVRDGDFVTITRSRTVPEATDSARQILSVAAGQLELLELTRGVRLLGLSVAGLEPAARDAEQLSLPLTPANGSARRERHRAATEAIDAVRARFGAGSVVPATLLEARSREPDALL
jgi:DNA polymerase-4